MTTITTSRISGPGPSIALFALALLGTGVGCHRDMRDQPRYEVYEASGFFPDGQSARPLVAGTVARGHLDEDEAFLTGREGGQLVSAIPVEIDRAVLLRGQERFNIFCAPCHAPTGDGEGMIVQRGFRKAASMHADRLRNAPAGHFFDVISNGFGAMPNYRVQISPRDRWAIVAYVRVLQMSQSANMDDVPADERKVLAEAAP